MTSAMHAVIWPSITPLAVICRFLPEDTFIFGYARSKLSDDDLRKKIKPGIGEGKDQDEFLSKIRYIAGQYDGSEGYQQVRPEMSFHAQGVPQCMCKLDHGAMSRPSAFAYLQASGRQSHRMGSGINDACTKVCTCCAASPRQAAGVSSWPRQLCCQQLSLTSHVCFCR